MHTAMQQCVQRVYKCLHGESLSLELPPPGQELEGGWVESPVAKQARRYICTAVSSPECTVSTQF
jgi:hypothetical protein